jgi:hypothetical protein
METIKKTIMEMMVRSAEMSEAFSEVLSNLESMIGKPSKALASALIAVRNDGLRAGQSLMALRKPLERLQDKAVFSKFVELYKICSEWKEYISEKASLVDSAAFEYGDVSEVPFMSGFDLSPAEEESNKKQRVFARESTRLAGIIRHFAIGLPNAGPSFDDCADVQNCLLTLLQAWKALSKLRAGFLEGTP